MVGDFVLAFGIFFIVWWCVFLALLPVGVRTQDEAGEVIRGTVSSAPVEFPMLRKSLQTTSVAGFLTGLVMFWI